MDRTNMSEAAIQSATGRENSSLLLGRQENRLDKDQSPWLSLLTILWLVGTVILLPIRIANLPSNIELVDLWIIGGLPVLSLFFLMRRTHKIGGLIYALPIWFILIASFISTFASPSLRNSLIVIIKEVYLFIWFFAVATFLLVLNARDLRSVLRIWAGVVVLHGLLMVAQFLSPDIWKFTNDLGGNTANLRFYRPAGMFICDAAGCANKAAFFQLMGFVPLLLAGFSKKATLITGMFFVVSILVTGSMGAAIALLVGLVVALFAISYVKKNLLLVINYLMLVSFALLILGGGAYVITGLNQGYQEHFERIILGRAERSSEGRFSLWQRGVDVLLDHGALFWGVGPENFREVDAAGTDNQLHNDALAFLVERGLIGVLGLALFAGIAMTSAIRILQFYSKDPKRGRLELVILLAALAAAVVESLTHQIFHTRELWLILAVQEAVLYKMMYSENGINVAEQVTKEPTQDQHQLLVQPDTAMVG